VLEYPFFNNESNDIQLLTDSERNLLIRTVSGLYRYSKGALEVITDQLMASNDLFVDKEGNIWVAASNGLYNYYKLNFKNYTLSKEGNMVHSIVVDKQNKVWMSTLDGEIIRIENSKAINIRFPAFPTEYSYFDKGSIAKDNLIYLTGGLGVLQYDCEKDKFQWLPDLPPKNLPLSNITDIAILPNSNLVIRSTTFSLIYHPKEGIKRIYKADELKQMIISSFVDKEGNILYYHN
jgi:sugar lactone lactonase YvrE